MIMEKILKVVFLPFVNKQYDLEHKWWHRLFKIIYIFGVIGYFFYLINDTPHKYSWLLTTNNSDLYIQSVRIAQVENIVLTYLFYIVIQFLYYKVLLYIIYGKK